MLRKIEDQWPRREHFHHYMDNVRCTYSLTVQIDITRLRHALKTNGIKTYPAQIYMLATAVNQLPEFRMGLSETGEPGYWDALHPSYTIFNSETDVFSSIWTPYDKDFSLFYGACMEDIDRYVKSGEFAPKKGMPPNVFDISSVPWVDFTAFNLNVYTEGTHLLPIFTIGKYIERDGNTFMPLALQLHHAACDGYHAGQFIEALRDIAQECHNWIYNHRAD